MAEPDHPTYDELHALLVGDLQEDRIQDVGSHLDSCASCRTKLDVLGGTDDTVVMGLRASKGLGAPETDEATASVLRRIAAIGVEPSEAGPGQALEERTPPLSGQLGAYVLLEKLGEGGMGAVYKARHVRLDKIVALKVLSSVRLADRSALARFEREMKAVGKVEHPNVVRAMDAGEVGGTHFLVMEYVQGTDLADMVRRRGPLPIADACELVRQAALGLQEAHEHGMVHRDVKPGNLMLTTRGVVKVLDLGLALLADGVEEHDLTGTGQVMGTVDYMAPEQCGDSHDVDVRADVYALGATLYRLLTGKPLFDGPKYQTVLAKLTALATQEPTPVRERRPEVPPGLAVVVARMIAKRKEDRFATPGEVAIALAPYCRGADSIALLSDARNEKSLATETPTASVLSAELDTTAGSIVALPKTASPPRKVSRWPLMAVAGALIPLAICGIVFFLQTPKGTIRVEVDDPAIAVSLKGEDLTIAGVGVEESRIAAGDHALVVTRGDLTFETKTFSLKRNDRVVVHATLIDGVVRIDADGSEIGRVGLPQSSIPVETPRTPSEGFALRFDGIDDLAIVKSLRKELLLKSPNRPFTVECWLLPDSPEGKDAYVYSWHGQAVAQDGRFLTGFMQSAGRSYYRTVRYYDETSNQLRHIAFVYDGSNFAIYLDGVASDQPRGVTTQRGTEWNEDDRLALLPDYPSSPLLLGHSLDREGRPWRFFAGVIDEVRVSDGIRYTADFTPSRRFDPDERTIALFHMDEGEGDVFRDASGNGHDGAIVGASWVSEAQAGQMHLSAGSAKVGRAGPPTASIPGESHADPARGFALRFDGVDDFAAVKDLGKELLLKTPNEPFTIELWFVPHPERKGGYLYAWQGHGIFLASKSLSAFLHTGEQSYSRSVPYDAQTHGFQHAALVYDGANYMIYCNGAASTASRYRTSKEGTERNDDDKLALGAEHSNAPFLLGHTTGPEEGHREFVASVIDEVRVSDVARYSGNFTPQRRFEPDEHTLALYHMDDGQGDVLTDSSAHRRHGKIVGPTWTAEGQAAWGEAAPDSDESNPEGVPAPSDESVLDAERGVARWALVRDVPFSLIVRDLETWPPFELKREADGANRDFVVLQASVGRRTDFDGRALSSLSEGSYLHTLSADNAGLTAEDTVTLSRFGRLFRADVRYTGIRTSRLAQDGDMPALVDLLLSVDQIDDQGKFVDRLPSLTKVGITGAVPEATALKLAERPTLRLLNVHGPADWSEGFADEMLRRNPRLRTVYWDEDGTRSIVGEEVLDGLRRLESAGAKLMYAGNFPTIEEIAQGVRYELAVENLPEGLAFDSEFATALDLVMLSYVTARKSTNTDLLAAAAARGGRLQGFYVRDSDLTDDGLRSLHAAKSLEMLEINGCPVTKPAVEELRQALPACYVTTSFGEFPPLLIESGQ